MSTLNELKEKLANRLANRLIFLDTETTGLDPENGHRICEIAAIEYQYGKPIGNQYHIYLNPERELEEEAAKVNGLSLEKLKNEVKFSEIAEFFESFLFPIWMGDFTFSYIVSHNAKFDMGFLKKEFERYEKISSNDYFPPYIELDRFICTKEMAKILYPDAKNSLNELCDRFGIDRSHREIHGAMKDVQLLSKVFFKLRDELLSKGFA